MITHFPSCTGRRQLLVSCVAFPAALATQSESTPARAAVTGPDLAEGYAEGDGAWLYLVQAGEGPLMLFLHGHPDSWALYEPQLREFGRDHLVAAPESARLPALGRARGSRGLRHAAPAGRRARPPGPPWPGAVHPHRK